MKDEILKWFASGETGISSEAMAFALVDVEPSRKWGRNHPADPADLNRCLKLLIAVPEARNHMNKIAAISGVWKNLVDNWTELEACFLDEVGIDWEKGRQLRATKTFEFMKRLGC